MKTIFKALLCVTLLSMVITSCSDDSETPVAPAGKMIASFRGTSWVSSAIAGTTNNTINVISHSDNKTIQVLVNKDNTVGTYEVTGAGTVTGYVPDAMVAYDQPLDAFVSAYFDNAVVVGSVTITEIDDVNMTISGTFYSKLKSVSDGSEYELTNGSFTKIPIHN
jgi:hypothetical protein